MYMQKVFVDTNVLMQHSQEIFNTYNKIIICGNVLEELDKHKYSSDNSKRYQARLATREIEINENKIDFIMNNFNYTLSPTFNEFSNDNKIINVLKILYDKDNDIIALSNDLNFRQKCKFIGIPVEKFNDNDFNNEYKGFIELDLNTNEIGQLYEELNNGANKYDFLENQYVIINEKGKRKPQEFRYSSGKLEQLKLPPSKFIKGMNSQQRCALDLLNNKDIPVKIIAGTFGSGKSYMTTKMALYHVFEKGNYGNILLVRNPVGSGEKVGYLPGEKENKVNDFFRCIEQYLDHQSPKDKNMLEYIKKDIPFYIKGMSYGSTYLLADECEDMDLQTLKLIGSRIESDSCVVFCGDYNQSERKYKYNNAFFQLIKQKKGHPQVGIVVLDENVRSEGSKVFSDI